MSRWTSRGVGAMGFSLLAVAVVSLWALATGPTPIAWTSIAHDLLHLGPPRLTGINRFFINDLRAPRVVLGLLAGATLATAGATYQGVFRNPLADPYLLGVAAGAGLGATVALVGVNGWTAPAGAVTWFAFVGALSSVALTWLVGGRSRRSGGATLVLAGVAISSLFTSAQTFVQQSANSSSIARVYIWLLGSLAQASWSTVWRVTPYVLIALMVALASARALDVLAVGDVESRSLGLPVSRVRFIVIVASSLGTAAVVSAVGLIGFVGLIVPHLIRLVVGTSYRRIMPLAITSGAAFLAFADTIARTVISPSELPLGVVTALFGAPVFVILLWTRQGATT